MILEDNLYQYLKDYCSGRRRALKAKDLAMKFNTSIREINKLVSHLRKDGRLIGSAKTSPYGYYIPINEAEVKEYLNDFRSELFDMLSTFNRQKKAKREYVESLRQDDLFPVRIMESGQMELVVKQ